MKLAHIALWFFVGFTVCYGVLEHQELSAVKADQIPLNNALAQCLVDKRIWEELVQKWGSDKSNCDAVIDFNKAIDVLEKETAAPVVGQVEEERKRRLEEERKKH